MTTEYEQQMALLESEILRRLNAAEAANKQPAYEPPVIPVAREEAAKIAADNKAHRANPQIFAPTVQGAIDAAVDEVGGNDEFRQAMYAIALAESGGSPKAKGDQGNSIGLYQNNRKGGRGAGYTEEQLRDPYFNAKLAAQELITYYKQAKQNGLNGPDVGVYMSRYGQRPAYGNWEQVRGQYGRNLPQGQIDSPAQQTAPLPVTQPAASPYKAAPIPKGAVNIDAQGNWIDLYGNPLGQARAVAPRASEAQQPSVFSQLVELPPIPTASGSAMGSVVDIIKENEGIGGRPDPNSAVAIGVRGGLPEAMSVRQNAPTIAQSLTVQRPMRTEIARDATAPNVPQKIRQVLSEAEEKAVADYVAQSGRVHQLGDDLYIPIRNDDGSVAARKATPQEREQIDSIRADKLNHEQEQAFKALSYAPVPVLQGAAALGQSRTGRDVLGTAALGVNAYLWGVPAALAPDQYNALQEMTRNPDGMIEGIKQAGAGLLALKGIGKASGVVAKAVDRAGVKGGLNHILSSALGFGAYETPSNVIKAATGEQTVGESLEHVAGAVKMGAQLGYVGQLYGAIAKGLDLGKAATIAGRSATEGAALPAVTGDFSLENIVLGAAFGAKGGKAEFEGRTLRGETDPLVANARKAESEAYQQKVEYDVKRERSKVDLLRKAAESGQYTVGPQKTVANEQTKAQAQTETKAPQKEAPATKEKASVKALPLGKGATDIAFEVGAKKGAEVKSDVNGIPETRIASEDLGRVRMQGGKSYDAAIGSGSKVNPHIVEADGKSVVVVRPKSAQDAVDIARQNYGLSADAQAKPLGVSGLKDLLRPKEDANVAVAKRIANGEKQPIAKAREAAKAIGAEVSETATFPAVKRAIQKKLDPLYGTTHTKAVGGYQTSEPIVELPRKKGEGARKGVIAKDLTEAQVAEITNRRPEKVEGGYFIEEKHIVRPKEAVKPPSPDVFAVEDVAPKTPPKKKAPAKTIPEEELVSFKMEGGQSPRRQKRRIIEMDEEPLHESPLAAGSLVYTYDAKGRKIRGTAGLVYDEAGKATPVVHTPKGDVPYTESWTERGVGSKRHAFTGESTEGAVAMQAPEILRVVRELQKEANDSPELFLKKYRGSLGAFISGEKSKIFLDPTLADDPNLLAKVVSHEIGHYVDRIGGGAIKDFRSEFIKELRSGEMREELKALSQKWDPLPESPTESHLRYRNQPKELYADFVSTVFNSPKLAAEMAPQFTKMFFEKLGQNAPAKAAYDKVQSLARRGPEEVSAARIDERIGGYERATETRKGREAAKVAARTMRPLTWRRVATKLLFQIQNTRAKTESAELRLAKKGVVFDRDNSAISRNRGMLSDNSDRRVTERINALADNLERTGVRFEVANVLMEAEAAKGFRADKFNPGFANRSSAAQDIEVLRQRYLNTPEKLQAARDLVDAVRAEAAEALEMLRGTVLSSQRVDELMQNKDSYARFVEEQYADITMPQGLKQIKGAINPIEAPIISTMLQTLMLRQWGRKALADRAAIGVIGKAQEMGLKEFRNAIIPESGEAKLPGYEKVVVMENGVKKGYWLDPELARELRYTEHETGDILKGIQWLNEAVTRPAIITYNPFFAFITNPIKDILGTHADTQRFLPQGGIEGIKNRSLTRYIVKDVLPSVKDAIAYAFKGKETAIVREILENNGIVQSGKEFFFGKATTPAEEFLSARGEIDLPNAKSEQFFQKLEDVTKVLGFIRKGGAAGEVLGKVAAYRRLRDAGWVKEYAAEYTADWAGTPNFRLRGAQTYWMNRIFQFSNINIQGLRRTSMGFASGKQPAAVYALQRFKYSILPKLMMAYFATKEDGPLYNLYKGVGLYDMLNYIVIPIGQGVDEDGRPTTKVIRLPMDEGGRMMGGIIYSMMARDKNFLATFGSTMGFVGEQSPSISPMVKNIGLGGSLLTGNNPEGYKGQPVIDPDVWATGDIGAAALQTGGAVVGNFGFTGGLPGTVANLAQGKLPPIPVYKETNTGLREKEREIREGAKVRASHKRIQKDEWVEQYKNGDEKIFSRLYKQGAITRGEKRELEEEVSMRRDERLFKDMNVADAVDAIALDPENATKLNILKKKLLGASRNRYRGLAPVDKLKVQAATGKYLSRR